MPEDVLGVIDEEVGRDLELKVSRPRQEVGGMAEEIVKGGVWQRGDRREVGEEESTLLRGLSRRHRFGAWRLPRDDVQDFASDPVVEVRTVRVIVRVRLALSKERGDVLGLGDLAEEVRVLLREVGPRQRAAKSELVGVVGVGGVGGRPGRQLELLPKRSRDRGAGALGVDGRLAAEVILCPEPPHLERGSC